MKTAGRIAVLYHYFESNSDYRDNFTHFLSTCYREDIDFYISISDSNHTLELLERPNIKYILCENRNLDFGGFSASLTSIDALDAYDSFIFINCSVRGPFLPDYVGGDWTEVFARHLTGDVHLVGTGFSRVPEDSRLITHLPKGAYAPPYDTLQTTAYALSRTALRRLQESGFYKTDATWTKDEVIALYEIRLSLEIRAQGWKIRCLLPTYSDGDGATLNLSARGGDPHQRRAFFSRTLSPLELIFVKTGRNMLSERELNSHTYTTLLAHRRNGVLPWSEGERLFERLERFMVEDMEAYRAFRKSFIWKTFRNTPPFRRFFP